MIDLAQFSGTEEYHKLSMFGKFVCTDGVKYLAEQAGAFWLIDAIASHQPKAMKNPRLRDFQLWFLKRGAGSACTLECWEDTGAGETAKIVQRIPFTDFPFSEVGDELKLYLENGVLCLPSER